MIHDAAKKEADLIAVDAISANHIISTLLEELGLLLSTGVSARGARPDLLVHCRDHCLA